jgi:pimeloyl-ACP methyl ester carboxylesterase
MLSPVLLLWLATSLPACSLEGVPAPVRCGTVEVFEDRRRGKGRRIPLKVVVLEATGAERSPDPVLILAGGPGQAATTLAADVAQEQAQVRQHRDVVLVDQRGTGGSNRLPCVPWDDEDLRSYVGEPGPAELRHCRQELERHADLRRYTTSDWVDDIEELRWRLGYERWNLDAGSYGTRVALLYMARYPERARSAVLRAVNPPGFRIPLSFPKAGQRALDALFDDCAADAACQADFPDLRDDFQSVLDRLSRGPVSARIQHPVTGELVEARITRDLFAARVHLVLFAPQLAARLPLLIHQAAQGDLGPFAQLAVDFGKAIADQLDWGQQLSVLCTEDLPLITPAEIERETKDTFLGSSIITDAQAHCRDWPRVSLPADWTRPVQAPIPTLLLSGGLDPATPPEFAAAAAARLLRARHVVAPHGTHMGGGACFDALAAALVERGSLEGLDAGCAAEVRRPSFARPAAGPAS